MPLFFQRNFHYSWQRSDKIHKLVLIAKAVTEGKRMKYVRLGSSPLEVSRVCLGSMTWGLQNNQQDANEQLDYAQTQGINFIDTAELYAVPPSEETYGKTETIIGHWLKANPSRRKEIVLASKIAGPGFSYIRDNSEISSNTIVEAVEASLKRLQTDYIDLYQLHWPNYTSPHFGNHWPNNIHYTSFNAEQQTEKMLDILQGLSNCIKAGKIRYIGLSNEKAWGTMRYLEESKANNLPRMITIQNAYSLLNRVFEGDMAEVSLRENIGLLAYSPMAFGVLSGKYIKETAANNARLKLFPRFARYSSEQATEATKQYLKIAEANNMTLAQMSLAFVTQQPFVTSNIIGATNLAQLKENIDSINVTLSDDVLTQINEVHAVIPNPAP